MTWLSLAACKGQDPNIFYPSTENWERDVARARRFCERCCVRDECLEDALGDVHFGNYGVRGGLSEIERKRLRRRRRRVSA